MTIDYFFKGLANIWHQLTADVNNTPAHEARGDESASKQVDRSSHAIIQSVLILSAKLSNPLLAEARSEPFYPIESSLISRVWDTLISAVGYMNVMSDRLISISIRQTPECTCVHLYLHSTCI